MLEKERKSTPADIETIRRIREYLRLKQETKIEKPVEKKEKDKKEEK